MNDSTRLNLQPPRPAWGLRPPVRKSLSTSGPIRVAPPPAAVCLSLVQRGGLAALPLVSPGQRVLKGEPVADAGGPGGSRLHASIAGQVTGIAERPVPGQAAPVPCILLNSDGTDEAWAGYPPIPDPASLPPAELRQRIAGAGMLGLGGALFPTADKLALAGEDTVLVVNGAECEPYISCDDMLLRERAGAVVAGTRILLAASGARRAVIAVKNDMPEARIALWEAVAQAGDERLSLAVVTARYPSGGERQLVELLLGREVPAGGLPTAVGCLCQNVATAAAVAGFCGTGQPLISRIVTVTGGGVGNPCNIEARLGTPIRELIALAGGYQGDPRRLIMGGPMMGIALPDDELPITAATNCLLVATAAELGAGSAELPCIRCGHCIEVCPARLLPQELLVAARATNGPALEQLAVDACIECGACDYVCPSHIPLTSQFVAAKTLLGAHRQARAAADRARERFEAREARLAAAAARREQALASLESARSNALAGLLNRSGRSGPTGD